MNCVGTIPNGAKKSTWSEKIDVDALEAAREKQAAWEVKGIEA